MVFGPVNEAFAVSGPDDGFRPGNSIIESTSPGGAAPTDTNTVNDSGAGALTPDVLNSINTPADAAGLLPGAQNPVVPATTPPPSGGTTEDILNAIDARNYSTIYTFFVVAGGWLSSLGGWLFDYAFESLVLQFGCWFTTEGGRTVYDGGAGGQQITCSNMNGEVGGVVNQLWTVIRDLFNLIFIFALVYIGLRLILNADESSTQRSAGYLIIAALLVNFSLYIAKLVIDVANFMAVQIHYAMVSGIEGQFSIITEGSPSADPGAIVTTSGVSSISGVFMQVINITSFFTTVEPGLAAVFLGLVIFIFFAFLGLILAYGAIMILARFVALVFLLILSPMMFLGLVLPQLDRYAKQWRETFLAYAFFIPAFCFLLYVSLLVLIQLNRSLIEGRLGYAEAMASGDDLGIFLMYFLAIGFLYASLKVAKAVSEAGAVVGMSSASKAAQTFTTAAAGRYVIGGAGGGALSGIGRGLEMVTGTNAGTRALIKGGTNLQSAKYGGIWSLKDSRDDAKQGKERLTKAKSESSRKKAVKNIESALKSKDRDKIKAALKDATGAQIEQIAQTKSGRGLLLGNIQYLKKDHVKAIKDSKSEAITDDFKQKIDTNHTDASKRSLLRNLGAPLTATGAIAPGAEITQLHQANKDQLDSVGVDKLKEEQNAARLSKKQMGLLEELKNDGKISSADFQEIKTKRESTLANIANGTSVPGSTQREELYRSAEAVPDLPDAALLALTNDLPRNALREIAKRSPKKIQQRIRTSLDARAVRPTPPAGTTLRDMDPGTMTDSEQLYMFLNFDDIGKDLGK